MGETATATARKPDGLIVLGLVVLAGMLPYLQTLRFGFTLDDANAILGHRGVQGPLAFEDVVLRDWWGRSRFDSIGTWRPFATLTFWGDQQVAGGAPWAFHLTNLVLYAGLLLLFDRFMQLWCGRALSVAGRRLAVLAFGALAIHGDVVPSPTGRAELLAALLSLGALYAATCTRTLGARESTLATALLFLALLSKESAAPMAVIVPLAAHRMHFSRRTFRRGALVGIALAAPLVLSVVAAFRILKMPFMQLGPERAMENPLLAVDAPHRLAGALEVLSFYLGHTLVGAGLAPDYSFSEPPLLRSGAAGALLGGGVFAACVTIVVLTWRRAPRVADATLVLGAAYLTVSNVVVAASAIADRLFFFPSLWLTVLIALVVDGAAQTVLLRRLACALTLLFAAAQCGRAAAYAAHWRDDVTLLGAAAHTYPNVFRTQRNLAHALADAHDDTGAAWHLTIAEAIYASYPRPVARDAIPSAWDRERLSERLAHLQGAFGAHAGCAAAAIAGARLTAWEAPDAAAQLSAWSRGACPP